MRIGSLLSSSSRPASLALLLGLAAIGVAEARDLPRGRAAAEPAATGCEAYGPGFHKIEGSETCIRISGSIRAEVAASTGSGDGSAGRTGFYAWRPSR